ncbi:protein-tyrosine phosphatase family protein [Micromonospora sp. NBC_01813]|uniref:protein-tyrosine phosphatase family protein n=1 Tax=Micromonospora sp. NBC_01813 TaxID=2975988 RepID=UPI002DDA8057|nr:protein phosphatase [Micromonospora sp. NBC_01813]WSA11218.1 protein phosphatase [Micromonospora sp. NBC_01813]
MAYTWTAGEAGVVQLPSGRLVRGRALRRALPPGPPPTLGIYLCGRRPTAAEWESRWIRWRDFWLPADRADAVAALREALERAGGERVEVACPGGKGRTGTALALIAILDGVAPEHAVTYVRERYSRHAVEMPWQRRFVASFPPPSDG